MVNTPTGISTNNNVLVMLSAIISSKAPIIADKGIRYLWSVVTNCLRIWGITNPTNPIMPLTETQAAVTREAVMSSIMRTLDTLTP